MKVLVEAVPNAFLQQLSVCSESEKNNYLDRFNES